MPYFFFGWERGLGQGLSFIKTSLWFIKTKRGRVFDAGGASLEGSALHGVVFDRYQRPDTSGRARLPRSRRESPSDPEQRGSLIRSWKLLGRDCVAVMQTTQSRQRDNLVATRMR